MAEQQITLTDLDPNQLQEVKKQLDEVGIGLRAFAHIHLTKEVFNSSVVGC